MSFGWIKGCQWLSPCVLDVEPRLWSPDGRDGQNPQGGEVATWGHEKWALKDIIRYPKQVFGPNLERREFWRQEFNSSLNSFFLKKNLFWFEGPGCMGKWGHRLDLGCVTVTQKVAILPRTITDPRFGSDTVETFKGLWRSESHHVFPSPAPDGSKKYPTVACNSLLARAIAKMAAKTDKAWWSHKRWSKCQCQQLQWSLQVFVIRVGVRLGNLNHCAAVKETQSGDKRQTLGSLQSRWQVPFYQSIHRFHGRLIDYDD